MMKGNTKMGEVAAIEESEKKKEDLLFEYLKDTNSKSRQVLNDIWLYYFYNNISMLIKNIRELVREHKYDNICHRKRHKYDKSDISHYLVTLNINIKSAYEYFDKLLYHIKIAYDYSRHNLIMYINNLEYEKSDEQFYKLINMSKETSKFILEDSIIEFDNHMNNIIDAFYMDEKEKYKKELNHSPTDISVIKKKEKKKEQKRKKKRRVYKEMRMLYNNLENARICVSNTFRILGDLLRFKSRYFIDNKKENELFACVNYYKSLNYFKFNGYIMNQLSLLYEQTNPIKGLFFYILSLISINPAPNRDALVMFLERVLKEGKCLVEKSMEEKRMAEKTKWSKENYTSYAGGLNRANRNSYGYRNRESCYFSFKAYKNAIRDIYNNEEYAYYNGNNNNTQSVNVAFDGKKLRDKKHFGRIPLNVVDNDLAEKELKLTLIHLHVSYFKIVRLLFSRIDMNKFEKKKNKLLYYINKYVKIQYYNNRVEDKLLFRCICIIIFTLLSIVLYTIINKHEPARSKDGFFFYGSIEISKYIYKNEQIYFSFLLIYDILLACKSFYNDFYSEYLSVFVYVLYWLNNENRIRPIRLDELTPEDGIERMKLIRQYYQGYKKKAMYIDMSYFRKESNEEMSNKANYAAYGETSYYAGKENQLGINSDHVKQETIDYTDIIQNIYDLLKSVKIKNEEKLDDSLLTYKLKEDFYVYPFLNSVTFERFHQNINGQKKKNIDQNGEKRRLHKKEQKSENEHVDKKTKRHKKKRDLVDSKEKYVKNCKNNNDETNEEDVVLSKKAAFQKMDCYSDCIKNKKEKNFKKVHADKKPVELCDVSKRKDWKYMNDFQKTDKSPIDMYVSAEIDKKNNSESSNILCQENDLSENEERGKKKEKTKKEKNDSTVDNPHKGHRESVNTFSSLFDFYTNETNFVIPSKYTMGDRQLEDLVRESRFISLLQSERNARDQYNMSINIFRQPLINANVKSGEKKREAQEESEKKESEEEEDEEYEEDENEESKSNESDSLTYETENGILTPKEIPNEELAEHYIYYTNVTYPNICWDLCEIDYEENLKNKEEKAYNNKKIERQNNNFQEKEYNKEKRKQRDDVNDDYKDPDIDEKEFLPKSKNSSKNHKHRKYLNSEEKRTYVSSSSKGKIGTSESKSFGYTSDTSCVVSSGIIDLSSSSSSCSSSSSSSSSDSSEANYRNKKKCHKNTINGKRKDLCMYGGTMSKIKENPYTHFGLETEKIKNGKDFFTTYRNKSTSLRTLGNNNFMYKLPQDRMYGSVYACEDKWKSKQEENIFLLKKNTNGIENEDSHMRNRSSEKKEVLVEQQWSGMQMNKKEDILHLLRNEYTNRITSVVTGVQQNEECKMNILRGNEEIEKRNGVVHTMKELHVNMDNEKKNLIKDYWDKVLLEQEQEKKKNENREYDMEGKYNEENIKCRVTEIYTDYILIDGMDIGGECIEGLKKKFNIFRIKMVLDYYKNKNRNMNIKIVMPREFLIGWNLFMNTNQNKNVHAKTDNNIINGSSSYCVNGGKNSCDLFSEYVELTENDLIFFKNLNIREFLIIQPLCTYYSYCVEYVTDYNSCLVTNSAFYKSYLVDVSDFIVPYTFFKNEFFPRVQVVPTRLKSEGNTKREC